MSNFAPDYSAPGRASRSLRGAPDGPNRIINIKMYVIVEIQGRQFKAEEGKKLFVNHMDGVEGGATVEFDRVLLADNNGDVKVGLPVLEGAKVVCEVVSPLVKGDKVLVFHKKRRNDYRKLNGHRQQFTELKIKQIIA